MLNGIPSLIIGNLGRDPEFQQVNGKQISRISIGVTPRVKRQGQWQDAPVLWYRVTVWDTFQAEHVLNSLHKGDRVFAYGVVTSDEYQGKTSLDMSADIVGVPLDRNDVTIIPRQQGGARQQQPQYQQAPPRTSQQSDPWGGSDDSPEF
ncbi:single-stranded DNA-binding protein [Bifidobacterium crudilactis]|uniref:single-stranded DNA-binding protein n=1 Tax=Bifidobacterium crudilactis TaxID=327277 RepID=UPI0026490164|nr:single-stranded DNA-binding protein [Bifidobacterium crudilactis]MDN5971846.1 single-stranded DNA-binding protein [Bifidobacterium crudilactis]MDN6001134.1 single-stranded DNA-binding protein [Bifidobacterium crudilactis]MDN6271909.1 single-stranded DNA-binding protein [Bifidobacterium crudilactis]MDN6466690.1 single-stranded DNA-binding protein [Bifidobacterium crudilactis]MDN6558107.1 single-stranded DNA-binding protein [Bifidobacterium crudilactis]